jgi:hypothetical protein
MLTLAMSGVVAGILVVLAIAGAAYFIKHRRRLKPVVRDAVGRAVDTVKDKVDDLS